MDIEQRIKSLEKEIAGLKKEIANQQMILHLHVKREDADLKELKEFINDFRKNMELISGSI